MIDEIMKNFGHSFIFHLILNFKFQSQMCQCSSFKVYVEIWYDDAPSFDAGFTTISRRRVVELRRCDTCGMHWQVDIGRGGLAIRIEHPENWNEFDDRPVRLQYMIEQDGGLDEGKCIWAGCNRAPLKGCRFCPHHAYPMFSNELDRNQ